MRKVYHRSNDSGFTMIEVIVVLILIGIISAVVVSRNTGSSNQIEKWTQVEKLKSHLRYAQTLAMNLETIWGIQFEDDTYKLYRFEDSPPPPPPLPQYLILKGEENIVVDMPNGISVSSVYISFDAWGRPYIGVNNNTMLLSDFSIGSNNEIIITANTGYIP